MKKHTKLVIAVSTLCFSSISLAAAPTNTQDQPGFLVKALQLTKSQLTTIKGLHETAQKCLDAVDVSGIQRNAIPDMVKSGELNENTLNAQITAQNTAHAQAETCRVTYYVDIAKTLTPTQKEKLADIQKRREMRN